MHGPLLVVSRVTFVLVLDHDCVIRRRELYVHVGDIGRFDIGRVAVADQLIVGGGR